MSNLVTITVADAALAIGETSLVTITFQDQLANIAWGTPLEDGLLTSTYLTVQNGTVSGLTSSDNGVTWHGTLTPTANINDTTNVITFDDTLIGDINTGMQGTGVSTSNNYILDSTGRRWPARSRFPIRCSRSATPQR